MFKPICKMNKQRQTAGETAKSKVLGAVSLLGLVVAITVEGSFIITAIGASAFALFAWLGGYMEGGEA